MTSTIVPHRASVIATLSRRAADILARHGYPEKPLTGDIDLGMLPIADMAALALSPAVASAEATDGGRHIDHEFKSHPDVFWPAARGEKTFEFRKDDRGGYHVGQVVRLRCYDRGGYVDVPPLDRRITNILRPGQFGLQEGYCILSLAPLSPTPDEVIKERDGRRPDGPGLSHSVSSRINNATSGSEAPGRDEAVRKHRFRRQEAAEDAFLAHDLAPLRQRISAALDAADAVPAPAAPRPSQREG